MKLLNAYNQKEEEAFSKIEPTKLMMTDNVYSYEEWIAIQKRILHPTWKDMWRRILTWFQKLIYRIRIYFK